MKKTNPVTFISEKTINLSSAELAQRVVKVKKWWDEQ